jgi:protein SCO1/2
MRFANQLSNCRVGSPAARVGALWAAIVFCSLAVFTGHAWSTTATAPEAEEAHMHHHHAMVPELSRSIANYEVPSVALVRDDGKPVDFSQELDDGRPVVLSFIYTSCTTVCPLTSHTLSQLQNLLGTARDSVHLVSVTIDPEFDTPARLRAYAAAFGAGPQWQHYTGTLAASKRAQTAFNVYRGNKMDHVPVSLIRTKPGAPWVRIEGFATPEQLLAELSVASSAN